MAGNEAEDGMDFQDDYEQDELLIALGRLGYQPLPDEEAWAKATQADSREDSTLPALFVSVCTYLVNELCDVSDLSHSKMQTPLDSVATTASFSLELRSFLSDYGAPFAHSGFDLVEQPSRKRMLIDYLIAELEACKMCKLKDAKFTLVVADSGVRPGAVSATSKPVYILRADSAVEQERRSRESERARALRVAAMALGLPKPPPTITCAQLFDKFETRISELLQRFDEPSRGALIGRPLLNVRLSDRQNAALLRLSDTMNKEYATRRAVLLKRFELTVSAFCWSDLIGKIKAEKKDDPIVSVLAMHKAKMTAAVPIGIAEVLAARDDVLRVEKSSSDSERTRTRTDLNRVRMGAVPDRGGRAWEVDPPERESKQQRVRPARGAPRGGGGAPRSGSNQRPYSHRGGANYRNQRYQHPQAQYGYDQAQAAFGYGNPNPYANAQAQFANPYQQQAMQNDYDGQAYDGPGMLDHPGGGYHRGRGGRGGRSRVQRGRPY